MSFPFLDKLPEPGAIETASLEFKSRLSGKDGAVDRFEIAKDVAALANTIGGTLLIGAAHTKGTPNRLDGYAPHTDVVAAEVVKIAEEAVRDRCFPAATFAPRLLPRDGGFVVALDVPPLPAPVAVRITAKENQHGHDAYVFFERVTAQTRPFSPELLPMLIDAHVRSMVIALRCIPDLSYEIDLRIGTRAGSTLNENPGWRIENIDERTNTVRLTKGPPGQNRECRNIPINFIETVYHDDGDGNQARRPQWIVICRSTMYLQGGP